MQQLFFSLFMHVCLFCCVSALHLILCLCWFVFIRPSLQTSCVALFPADAGWRASAVDAVSVGGHQCLKIPARRITLGYAQHLEILALVAVAPVPAVLSTSARKAFISWQELFL